MSRRRIAQHAVVGRANDVVGAAQAEREIAARARRSSASSAATGFVKRLMTRYCWPPKKNSLLLARAGRRCPLEVAELELGLGAVAVGVAGGEEVGLVELLVAKVVARGALKAVGAAARDDVDGGAAVAAELGREVRRLDLDLIDEAQADVVDLAAVRAGVEVGAAVDRQVVGVAAVAVDRLAGDAQARRERQRIVVGRDRAGNQRRELEIVAAVERQILDLLRVDRARDLAARAVDGLAQDRRDFDLTRCSSADSEAEIGGDAAVGAELRSRCAAPCGNLRAPTSTE